MISRIHRATSPAISSGAFGQLPGSHTAPDTLAHSNIVNLPSRSLPGGSNLAAASPRSSFLLDLKEVLSLGLFLFVVLAPAMVVGAIVVGYALFVAEPV
jgi:hypothetical protein